MISLPVDPHCEESSKPDQQRVINDDSLCLNFFHVLALKSNLEKFSIHSNQILS